MWNIDAQIAARRAGRRKNVHHGGTLCSRCLERPPASPKVRYCGECHAAYERDRRRAAREELKRLRALVQQSKGQDNDAEDRA